MGMSLNSGGHLTHGYRHNISSKMLHAVLYDVDPKTELLDYSALAAQTKNEKPLILMAGYSAHPRRINFAKMREIADSVGAVFLSIWPILLDWSQAESLPANLIPSPMPISSLRRRIKLFGAQGAVLSFANRSLENRSTKGVPSPWRPSSPCHGSQGNRF